VNRGTLPQISHRYKTHPIANCSPGNLILWAKSEFAEVSVFRTNGGFSVQVSALMFFSLTPEAFIFGTRNFIFQYFVTPTDSSIEKIFR